MRRVGSTAIVSVDTGFDRLPNIERLDPANITNWLGRLESQDRA
jgi:hypothetical protein